MRPPKHVVYFKKDLRITDHAPLCSALEADPIEAIYLIEPDLWKEPGFREVALGIYTELGSRRKANRKASRATKQS